MCGVRNTVCGVRNTVCGVVVVAMLMVFPAVAAADTINRYVCSYVVFIPTCKVYTVHCTLYNVPYIPYTIRIPYWTTPANGI